MLFKEDARQAAKDEEQRLRDVMEVGPVVSLQYPWKLVTKNVRTLTIVSNIELSKTKIRLKTLAFICNNITNLQSYELSVGSTGNKNIGEALYCLVSHFHFTSF